MELNSKLDICKKCISDFMGKYLSRIHHKNKEMANRKMRSSDMEEEWKVKKGNGGKGSLIS